MYNYPMDKKDRFPKSRRKPMRIGLSTVTLPYILHDERLLEQHETCVFVYKDGEMVDSEVLGRYSSLAEAHRGHRKWLDHIEHLDDPDYREAIFDLEEVV